MARGVQPSGSMEECVSEHGVYDQIGNAWEWVDLEQTANRDDWIQYVSMIKVEVSQTLIQVKEGMLQYNAVCVDMKRACLGSRAAHWRSSNPNIERLLNSRAWLPVVPKQRSSRRKDPRTRFSFT